MRWQDWVPGDRMSDAGACRRSCRVTPRTRHAPDHACDSNHADDHDAVVVEPDRQQIARRYRHRERDRPGPFWHRRRRSVGRHTSERPAIPVARRGIASGPNGLYRAGSGHTPDRYRTDTHFSHDRGVDLQPDADHSAIYRPADPRRARTPGRGHRRGHRHRRYSRVHRWPRCWHAQSAWRRAGRRRHVVLVRQPAACTSCGPAPRLVSDQVGTNTPHSRMFPSSRTVASPKCSFRDPKSFLSMQGSAPR